jgi:HEAT repeat protein
MGVLIGQLGDPSRSNQALLALLVKGEEAVPALAEFLRTSKPSSLPEPRLLAVEGLSTLKGSAALEALIAVASEPLGNIPDPVIRLSEESVASRAACALAEFADQPRAVETLHALLQGKPLVGVAEAFTKLKDSQAVPRLAAWLEEDFVAEAARNAIMACGATSVPALLDSLSEKHTLHGIETGASKRRRARILGILSELASVSQIGEIEHVLDDPIENVRWQAVRLFAAKGNPSEQRRAFQSAIGFLDSSDNYIRAESEELLLAHLELGQDLVKGEIERRQALGRAEDDFQPRWTTLTIFRRILRRGTQVNR